MLRNPVVEERFIYKGYPCVVLFMPAGFRAGYVGLPKTNKLYGQEYGKNACFGIACHGGITYGRSYLYGQDDKDTWWIGFDCGHFIDRIDLEQANKYFKYDEETKKILLSLISVPPLRDIHSTADGVPCEIRTLDYVKENCKRIVEQIIELER